MVRRDRERYSQRALRTLAGFGLTVDDVGLGEAACGRAMARLRGLGERVIAEMRGGCIVAITGASGAGKSTLLRLIGELADEREIRVVWPPRAQGLGNCRGHAIDLVARACMDCAGGEARRERALRPLARAGLADARLVVMRAYELSDGERARLALAIGMARCGDGRGCVLLVDEFGAALDDVTAGSVARGLVRWCEGTAGSAVVVTHHESLVRKLRARVVVKL